MTPRAAYPPSRGLTIAQQQDLEEMKEQAVSTIKQRLGCCPEGHCIDEDAIRVDERARCLKIVRDFSAYTGRGREDQNTLMGMFARGNRNAVRCIAAALSTTKET